VLSFIQFPFFLTFETEFPNIFQANLVLILVSRHKGLVQKLIDRLVVLNS
jgi:hypothetical protein